MREIWLEVPDGRSRRPSRTRDDGTRILRHVLPPAGAETIVTPNGGLSVFADGELQMGVGPPILVEDEEDGDSCADWLESRRRLV
jgi:hypothetical protein